MSQRPLAVFLKQSLCLDRRAPTHQLELVAQLSLARPLASFPRPRIRAPRKIAPRAPADVNDRTGRGRCAADSPHQWTLRLVPLHTGQAMDPTWLSPSTAGCD